MAEPLRRPDDIRKQFGDILEVARGYESLANREILSPSRWQDKEPPRRNWMVENCFLQGTVGMVSGDGGIGKSLLMQQLASCAVLGKPWLGLSLTPGKALYLACEDDGDELWRRQAAICKAINCEMSDLGDGGLELWPRVGQNNAMMYLERSTWKMTPTELFSRVAHRCGKYGHQYVIIDTATQTFRGNQNDEIQVADYITELRRLAIKIQGVVILTKHPSMTGRALGTGESGNVAWNNGVRSRLYLHKDKAGQLVLDVMKNNYASAENKIALKWQAGVYVRDEPAIAASWYDRD